MFAATLPSESTPPEQRFQRSTGIAELSFAADGGIRTAFQSGALKLRFPKHRAGNPREAVLINLAGGLTGGDHLNLIVNLAAGARAGLTGQACERLYRSLGSDAVIEISLNLAEGASFDYLLQPTILFDGARLKRGLRIDMAGNARLLAVEAVIFGRTAHEEVVRSGALSDACFIRREGRLMHAERFLLSGEIEEKLKRPTLLDGHVAMATLRYVAPDAEGKLEEVRAALEEAKGEAAASAWDGMLVVRFAAKDGFTLNHDLMHMIGKLRHAGSPRMWSL